VHALRAALRDLNGLGEHTASLALAPFRIEQVSVEREHHPRLEAIADLLDGLAVGRNRVVAIARVLQRGEPVPVNAGLADAEPARIVSSLTASSATEIVLPGPKLSSPRW